MDLERAQNRIAVHWCRSSDCYSTDMADYAGIARAFIFVRRPALWDGEELSEEGLRQLAATITGFGDDNVNRAGANAPNPGALYLSITRLPLHKYGSRDAKSSNSGLRARGDDAYSMGTSKFSMGTSKVQTALKAAPQYRCNPCGCRFGSNADHPRCPECKSRSSSQFLL